MKKRLLVVALVVVMLISVSASALSVVAQTLSSYEKAEIPP